MPDEYPIGIRITGEQPPIPVGTAVNLSGPNGHAEFAPCSIPSHIGAEGASIGVTQAELRKAHLKYHVVTSELLTPTQMQHYAQLRGYAGEDSAASTGR